MNERGAQHVCLPIYELIVHQVGGLVSETAKVMVASSLTELSVLGMEGYLYRMLARHCEYQAKLAEEGLAKGFGDTRAHNAD
jgi:hypothetical protein